MIKAVVFDLDDTLISELDYIKSGYRIIANSLSKKFNVSSDEIYETLLQTYVDDSKRVFNRLFETYGRSYTQKDIDELVSLYRNHIPTISFFDDVMSTILALKALNIKLGIITDGYKESQRLKIKAINAIELFDHIIITDELGREFWKPHPYAFEIMSKALEVEYDEMIYIGDNPAKDFYISSIYPIKTIRITRENSVHSSNEYYQNITENGVINNLDEIITIITI